MTSERVVDALTRAHDEWALVGGKCTAMDLIYEDRNGDPHMMSVTVKLDEHFGGAVKMMVDNLVSVAREQITAMCLQGAMLRGARGDTNLYREMYPFVVAAILDRVRFHDISYDPHNVNIAAKFNDTPQLLEGRIRETTLDDALDVLLLARKLAESEIDG